MTRPVAHVIRRFPEHELAIECLAQSSESFRSMCEDYAIGVEALKRWEREREGELRESLAELEPEILQALEEAGHRSGMRDPEQAKLRRRQPARRSHNALLDRSAKASWHHERDAGPKQ